MSDRRKLHARRALGTDSSFSTPDHNSATTSAFVWPTDRIGSQQTTLRGNDTDTGIFDSYSDNVAPAPESTHPVTPLSQYTSRSLTGTFTSQPRSAAADNEFKWISDYLDVADDADIGAGHIPQHAPGCQVPPLVHPPTDVRLQPVGQPHSLPAPAGRTTHRPAVQPAAQPTGQTARRTAVRTVGRTAVRTLGQAAPSRQRGQVPSRSQSNAAGSAAAATSVPAAGTAGAAAAAGTAAAAEAAGSVAVAAGSAALTAGSWLGAAAGLVLDRLMGVDPNLVAAVGSVDSAGCSLPHMRHQQQQQRMPTAASVQEQAAENPLQHNQHRYMTRRRLQAIRNPQPDPQQQQQQQEGAAGQPSQQQQVPANSSTSSQGWAWVVVLGLTALVSDAVTAVTTAYTESLRPSAELLWHVAAVLFLYLLLPLLRMLLAAVKLLLGAFGRVIRTANMPIGKLQAAGTGQHQHAQQTCDPQQKTVQEQRWPWGRALTCILRARTRGSAAAGATSEQQQLVRLAEQHLSNVNTRHQGVLTLLEFDVLCSASGGFSSEQLLNPACSGYGACAYRGSGPKGESAALQVVALTTQQEVEAWCAAVAGLARLQQAATQLSTHQAATSSSSSSSQSDMAALLPVLGVAVGTLPAAATMQAFQQQQQQPHGQQPGGCAIVGLVAVQLQEQQPFSLLSLVSGAGTPTTSSSGDAHIHTLQTLCTALKCAAQAAAAVGQLCTTMTHSMDPAAAAAAGAAAGDSLSVLTKLLQGVSCTQLAVSLVVGPVTQHTQLRLNPATLLLALHKCSPESAQQELRLLLPAVQQLQQQQQHQGAAAIQTAAAVPAGGPLVGHGSAGWCLRQLEQRLRDVQQQEHSPQDLQSQCPTADSSSSCQRSTHITEASLVRALSGVLLMLLSGDAGQGALLAPDQGISPSVAQALRQLQESRVRGLVQQGQASTILGLSRSGGISGSSSTGQLPVAVGPTIMSREVTTRLEQVCQAALQHVLLCCTWADAVTAAAGAGAATATSTTAGSSSSSSRSWFQKAAKRTFRASVNTPAGGAAGQHPAHFDWQGLVQALQQAAEGAAGVCQLHQQQLHQPPEAYLCPISRELMCDPVVACDGHTYERRAITEWIKVCGARRVPCKSPMTSLPMVPNLVPNHALRSLIKEWQEQHV